MAIAVDLIRFSCQNGKKSGVNREKNSTIDNNETAKVNNFSEIRWYDSDKSSVEEDEAKRNVEKDTRAKKKSTQFYLLKKLRDNSLGWCLYILKMVKKVLSSGYIIRAFIDISNHDRGTWRVSHYHRLSPVFTNPPPPHQGVFTHLSIIFSSCWWIYIRYSVHHIRTISLSICRQSQWINEWICCCDRTASFESNFAQMVKHT